jgi:hypothetical protein
MLNVHFFSVNCKQGKPLLQSHNRLFHEIAKPVLSADMFFELSYHENFLESRYFIHANRKKAPQNGYVHTSISVNSKKTSCLGV